MAVLIGTAGWALPRAEQEHFAGVGSLLERYAAVFRVAEINSSFRRSHRVATWTRWRDAVPSGFRFSVKLPKAITHTARLVDADDLLDAFLAESAALETKLGAFLVQLPPSLAFHRAQAQRFFAAVRARTTTPIACEPRHESWFDAAADELLRSYQIARVAADPARVPLAAEPGRWRGLTYYRLHGSPKVYYSSYDATFITSLAARLKEDRAADHDAWVIFDNTTLGAATRNALDLTRALQE
jgi:uncharacterized protein YecE (DUF72 family)